MFDDPTESAEDRMSDAFGCVLAVAGGAALLVIGAVIMIVRTLL
jgi:hypothetical protein